MRTDKESSRARPAVAIKATEEWAGWLRRLSDHASMPTTTLIDQALKAYARSIYFDEPMPKRLPPPKRLAS